jgi:hypothetical protein
MILQDHSFAVTDQYQQGLECLRRKGNGLIITEQEQFVREYAKGTELVELLCFLAHNAALINPEKF